MHLMPSPPERPFRELSPFEQRLKLLSEREKKKPAQLVPGLSSDTVNKWRRESSAGKPPPRGEALQKFADALDVPVDWLLDPRPIAHDAKIPSAREFQAEWRKEYNRMTEEIGSRLHLVSENSAPQRSGERDDIDRAKDIAHDIAADGVFSYEAALAACLEVKFVDGDDLAWRRQTLRALELGRRPGKEAGRAPTPPHPKKPPKVGR